MILPQLFNISTTFSTFPTLGRMILHLFNNMLGCRSFFMSRFPTFFQLFIYDYDLGGSTSLTSLTSPLGFPRGPRLTPSRSTVLTPPAALSNKTSTSWSSKRLHWQLDQWLAAGDFIRKMSWKLLLGGWATPLKNMTSSIGMISNPIYGKIKNGNQTTNQIMIADHCTSSYFHHQLCFQVVAHRWWAIRLSMFCSWRLFCHSDGLLCPHALQLH